MVARQTGNPDLKPEKADNFTIGFAAHGRPSRRDLSLSVDYWKTEIEDAIRLIPGLGHLSPALLSRLQPGPAARASAAIRRA